MFFDLDKSLTDNVEFLGSKGSSSNMNTNETKAAPSSNGEPTPYDFADDKKEPAKGTDVDSNPFADFGSNIEISDDELPF